MNAHLIHPPVVRRGTWLRLVGAWAVAAGALFFWLQTPQGALREELKVVQFWWLEVCLVLLLASGIAVWQEIRTLLTAPDRWRLAGVTALALGLTLIVAPRTNRIYFDEQIYQNIGQNLSDLRLAQICNDGVVEYGRLRCVAGEYNKEPYAYPHVLSVAYRLFGVREDVGFAVNAAAMAASVVVLYLLVLLLFKNRDAAFFAALLLALTPQQILWSATAAVEPTASLALLISVLCAAQFATSRSAASLTATVAATAYAAQFRPESLLVTVVVAWILCWESRQELATPRLWWAALGLSALLAVHIGHLFSVRNESWGAEAARISWSYVAGNFAVNGPFYLGDERYPAMFTLLALLGVFGGGWTRRGALALYLALFFGIYLFFYAGSYNYGADVRYSLMTYPPLAAFGGLGASLLARQLANRWSALTAQPLVVGVLLLHFLSYMPVVRAITEEAWGARADVRFARSVVPMLRGNSYVLTHNPSMFQVWGVNAGQMSLVATSPAYLADLETRFPGRVYLHWNFWCNVQDPVQRSLCDRAAAIQPIEIAAEYRERDQYLALYRFVKKSAQAIR